MGELSLLDMLITHREGECVLVWEIKYEDKESATYSSGVFHVLASDVLTATLVAATVFAKLEEANGYSGDITSIHVIGGEAGIYRDYHVQCGRSKEKAHEVAE